MYKFLAILGLVAITAAPVGPTLGRPATPSTIANEDLTVFADGSGLPDGSGTARQGKTIFATQCAACHGVRGEGNANYPALVGGIGSLSGTNPVLTVGSYWPYATTVWDFIRRAMPYNRPGTLQPDQVYALTAYILRLNGIVDDTTTLNRVTLPRIRMPNRSGFVSDSRPDVQQRR